MENNFSIKENSYHIDNVFMVRINTDLISVLRQSRSFISSNGIDDLVSSFAKKGQKTPGDIYAFTKVEAISYIQEINDLWNTDYKIESFNNSYIKEKKDYFYLFLVAGHRRLKACKFLKFDYFANLHFEKSFEEAIEWQLAENVQREELPLLDLITSATAYWIKLKKKNPKLTMLAFAKNHIHKSVSWLTNALRFSRLPISVQDLIRKTDSNKGVNYSIMLEFAKLYDFSVQKHESLNPDFLISLINHCITHKYKLEKVKEFCEVKKIEIFGQQTLFELIPEEVNKNSLTAIRRFRTEHMSEATSYLTASEVIARQITEKCKDLASDVIEKGERLDQILNS